MKWNKPTAGSRGYWHRKRAKRIHPRLGGKSVLASIHTDKVMPVAFAGYKAGMTRISYVNERKGSAFYGQETVKAVTVLDCPPLVVFGIKTYRKTPYGLEEKSCVLAEKQSKDLNRKISVSKDLKTKSKLEEIEKGLSSLHDIRLIVHTQPRESGVNKKTPELFEIGLFGNVKSKWSYAKEKLGGQLKLEDMFKEGEFIDVQAVTTGKGTQGPVKRHGIKVRSRKNKGKQRHVGSLGPYHPARVLPVYIPHPGQMGYHNRTDFNKRVLKISSDGLNPAGGWVNYGVVKGNYILLEGSVPGPRKRLIILRKAVRFHGKEEPFKISTVSLESQQGS